MTAVPWLLLAAVTGCYLYSRILAARARQRRQQGHTDLLACEAIARTPFTGKGLP